MVKGSREDRLSNLPDDILLTVIDRLNVREATRTSALSSRWRQLPAMLSRLTINALDFLPKDVSTFYNEDIVRINAALVEATKSILANRDSSQNTIQLLCMTFYLRDDDPISIGHAVGHTMATQKVEMAEFTVLTVRESIYCNDEDLVDYGRQFILFFDACQNAFRGLTRLQLVNLRFGPSDIPNVLITCKGLKHLSLSNCDSGSWTMLQVEHSQLSELSIIDCCFERVKLSWLPKLTRMTFEGWISFQDPLSLGYVPLLEAVSLTNVGLSWHKMVKLSKFFGGTSVRDLKLGFKCEKIWVQPECLTQRLASVFHQLRFLNLVEIPEGYDLTWTLFILAAAPSLKELYMTVWDHLCKMETDVEVRRTLSYSEEKGVDWELPASNFQHHNLARLTIFGFQSEDYMVRYVRRVIDAAVNLEDVFLYRRLACKKCHGNSTKPFKFPFTKRQRSSVKNRINQGIDQFVTRLPIFHFPTGDVIRADHLAKMKYP